MSGEHSIGFPSLFPCFHSLAPRLGEFVVKQRIITGVWFYRISKEDRAAGVLDNYKEGETYKNHGLRSFVANHEPQIMPGVNNYFSGAK
jgi:hypothetical protein